MNSSINWISKNLFDFCRKSIDCDAPGTKVPVKFRISDDETQELMDMPEIKVDPPSKQSTPETSSKL